MLKKTCFILSLYFIMTATGKAQYFSRSLSSAPETKEQFSNTTAHYMNIYGDGISDKLLGLKRYALLRIDSAGKSAPVQFSNEEQVLFVLSGTGILNYDKKEVPVSTNDFFYIPSGKKYSIYNPRDREISIIVMGFPIFTGTVVKPTEKLMIANTDEVSLQVLPSHGPTTQFQLLMGTTESTRDRLAAAYQVTSLFIMDFAAGGTNNPHKHADEEEVYLILKGKGDLVAGTDQAGEIVRHPAKEGDLYFYSPNTTIGFYSGNTETEEHAKILAVRFKYPVQKKTK